MKPIYHIYDRIFKRIFNLSNLAIINLINGLFGTNYPLDSKVTYPNKEFVNEQLDHRFADLFITINDVHTYHLEAQMEKDETIVIRAFEYSFYFALANRKNNEELEFPEPIVIYLGDGVNIPEKSTLTIRFQNQGIFQYQLKNYLYLNHNVTELNQKKMVILIPFRLLKLRKIIKEEPSEANFEMLKNLIQNDIIGSIKANQKVGNITLDDANQQMELTKQLYEHIYQHYEELGGAKELKPLLEGAMELPMDKYRIKIDELETKNRETEVKLREAEEKSRTAEEEIRRLKARLEETEQKKK